MGCDGMGWDGDVFVSMYLDAGKDAGHSFASPVSRQQQPGNAQVGAMRPFLQRVTANANNKRGR
jgi:hypothetical protein